MTPSEKQTEIAVRIARLSEIREELAVARRKLQDGLGCLEAACRAINRESAARGLAWNGEYHHPKAWPSRDEVEAMDGTIATLKSEADQLIEKLTSFGVDSGLFKINGA